jgi:hypothetical protein
MTDAGASADTSWIHAVRRAGLAALAVMLLAAIGAMTVRSHGSAAPAQRASAASARLPLAAQALVSRALGRDDASYWAQRSAGGLQAVNRAQRLRAQFDRGSVLVGSGGVSLGLSLRAYGYGAALQPLSAVTARAAANQVVYVHAGVSEWYANGPLGLEQGFTVPAAPAGRHAGPLTLELGLSGDARGRLLRGADGVMFTGADGALAYQGLVATDARGRALPAWIELRGSELLLRVVAAGASYPIRVDPFVQQGKLTASDGAEFDALGTSVAISGDTIVVGAASATVGSNPDQGAAYLFVKPRSGWADGTQIAKLTASDGAASNNFGSSVAISDGTVVVGAPDVTVTGNLDQGAAYVFVRPRSGWADATQTAKLTASGGTTFDLLGTSVAISGDTVAAGAPGATVTGNASQGAAYVFVRPRSGWADATQTAKLTASGGGPEDLLGSSVAIDGDTIAAGAPSPPVAQHPDLGAVYVFVRPRSGWADATDTAKLTASDIVSGENFGLSVAISGGTVVAGAPDATVGGNLEQGAVDVFVKPRSGWADGTQTAKLTASDGASDNLLGLSVAISGDTVAAGADLATVGANASQGAAYVFVKPGSGWADGTQTAKLTASDGASLDRLGASVAISGSTVVAGAPGATVDANLFQGAAYVFSRTQRHGR